MKKSIGALFAAAVLILAACGGGSDGGDSGSPQDEAAQQAIAEADEAGFALDENCVRDLASQLSDEDAQTIIDSGADDPELSTEGEALTLELLDCVSNDELVEQFISEMIATGDNVDEDCVRAALSDFDLSEVIASGGEPPSEMINALISCTGG